MLPIADIYYPDSSFLCLAVLGEPIEIVEDHHLGGNDYLYKYEGFNLFFSNVTTGKLKLSLLEIYPLENVFLDLSEGNRISSTKALKDQFVESNTEEINFPRSGSFSINFNEDGTHMRYEREGMEIKKIKIYF